MTPHYWTYYPTYYNPPFAFQPMFLQYEIYSLTLTTYYQKLYIKALDTQRKSFETKFKALETTKTQPA